MIEQGDLWWGNLPPPVGSEPGYHRPVIIIQSDRINRSRLPTTVCVMVTSNLRLLSAPGNVLLPQKQTGLPMDSVANVSQIYTLNKSRFSERVGKLPEPLLAEVYRGLSLVLGRCVEPPPALG